MNHKVPREYIYICGFNRRKLTVNHTWRILQARHINSIECYVDANFANGWDQADADNEGNFMSHTGYVITYIGYLVLRCIKLQT